MNREDIEEWIAHPNHALNRITISEFKALCELALRNLKAGYSVPQGEPQRAGVLVPEGELAALRAEVAEQCRLNGMGQEREARLMAQLQEAERKLAELMKEGRE